MAIYTTLTEFLNEFDNAVYSSDIYEQLSGVDVSATILNDDAGIVYIINNITSNLVSVLPSYDNTGALVTGTMGASGEIITNNLLFNCFPGWESSGNGILLGRNPYWDNSFNTQGFSVDASGSSGYTYFDISYNLLVDKLEHPGDQNYMKTNFLMNGGVEFIYNPTGDTIGKIEQFSDRIKFKTTSDERLKTKIENLTPKEGLDLCIKIKPVRFNWKKNSSGKPIVGFIAQDVYKILNLNYNENIESVQFLDYSLFTPIIISAIQYLQERIGHLTNYLTDN